jgi:hypothetical protein
MEDLLQQIGGGKLQTFEDMGDGTNAPTVWSVSGALATDGTVLDLNSLAQTLSYNGNNTVNYIQVTLNDNTYRQTFGYTNGNLTSVSEWIKQ